MKNYDELGKFGWNSLLEGTDRAGASNTWFVDSNGGSAANNANAGQGASWSAPFATLNYAISRCADGGRNVIMVAAGHAETWTTAQTTSGTTTTGCCLDKNDVTIIGLGTGSYRPTITFTGTAGTLYVDATNCSIYGLIFYSTVANHVTCIDAQSGADGLLIENCKFFASAANTETIDCITITANCDDVTIRGNKFYNVDTNDGSLAAITLQGGSDRIRIIDNVFDGDFNEEVIDMNTAGSTEIEIVGNYCNNIDAGYSCFIATHASCTGVIADNVIYCPATGSAGGVIADAYCLKSNNQITTTLAVEAGDATRDTSGLHQKYYVDSGTGVDTNDGLSWETALLTIGTAIDKCTSANGDEIHVAAGFAQDITGAGTTTEFDMDCIGVSVIGHGTGDNRPVFTFITDATNACVDVTTANCRLENLVFACNMASQKYMVYARTSADGLEIRNCEFREGGQQPLSAILLGGGDGQADGVIIDNNRIYLPTAGPQDNAIEVLFDMANVEITNNYIMGNFDEAAIEIPAGGNASADIIVKNNIIINEQTGISCIEVEETALTVTGICANNILVNDNRKTALIPNILNCYGNVWMNLGSNMKPVVLEGDLTTPGQNIYVNSAHTQATDDTAHGGSWDYPLAKIEYALAQGMVIADNNDIIHVGPGHEETITNAVYLDFDVAGITVLGYGNGTNRPTVTFEGTNAAVVDVGASNITIKNFIFRASIDAIAIGVDILAGMTNCKIIDCDFGPGEGATDEFAIALQVNAGCNYTEISGCKFYAGAAAAVASIKIEGTSTHVDIHDCVFTGAHSGQCILGGTAASTDVDIHHNSFATTSAVPTLSLVAASTGMVRHNDIVVGSADFATAMDIGNCWNIFNKMIANDDLGGAKCDNRYTAAGTVTETADG